VPIPGATNPTLTVTTAGSYALRTIWNICGFEYGRCDDFAPHHLLPTRISGYGNSAISQTACFNLPDLYLMRLIVTTNASIHPIPLKHVIIDDDCVAWWMKV
jgi:hypothetical protein